MRITADNVLAHLDVVETNARSVPRLHKVAPLMQSLERPSAASTHPPQAECTATPPNSDSCAELTKPAQSHQPLETNRLRKSSRTFETDGDIPTTHSPQSAEPLDDTPTRSITSPCAHAHDPDILASLSSTGTPHTNQTLPAPVINQNISLPSTASPRAQPTPPAGGALKKPAKSKLAAQSGSGSSPPSSTQSHPRGRTVELTTQHEAYPAGHAVATQEDHDTSSHSVPTLDNRAHGTSRKRHTTSSSSDSRERPTLKKKKEEKKRKEVSTTVPLFMRPRNRPRFPEFRDGIIPSNHTYQPQSTPIRYYDDLSCPTTEHIHRAEDPSQSPDMSLTCPRDDCTWSEDKHATLEGIVQYMLHAFSAHRTLFCRPITTPDRASVELASAQAMGTGEMVFQCSLCSALRMSGRGERKHPSECPRIVGLRWQGLVLSYGQRFGTRTHLMRHIQGCMNAEQLAELVEHPGRLKESDDRKFLSSRVLSSSNNIPPSQCRSLTRIYHGSRYICQSTQRHLKDSLCRCDSWKAGRRDWRHSHPLDCICNATSKLEG